MLLGFYQYFGLYCCTRALRGVLNRVEKCWQRALRRRSQKGRRRTDWRTLNSRPLVQAAITSTGGQVGVTRDLHLTDLFWGARCGKSFCR
jgi:hypothetical protein